MHESMHYLLILQGSLNVCLGERGFWAFIQCKACVHLPMWTRTGPQKGVDVFIFFVVLLECYKAPEKGGLTACSLLLLRRLKTKRVRGGGRGGKLPWPS